MMKHTHFWIKVPFSVNDYISSTQCQEPFKLMHNLEKRPRPRQSLAWLPNSYLHGSLDSWVILSLETCGNIFNQTTKNYVCPLLGLYKLTGRKLISRKEHTNFNTVDCGCMIRFSGRSAKLTLAFHGSSWRCTFLGACLRAALTTYILLRFSETVSIYLKLHRTPWNAWLLGPFKPTTLGSYLQVGTSTFPSQKLVCFSWLFHSLNTNQTPIRCQAPCHQPS